MTVKTPYADINIYVEDGFLHVVAYKLTTDYWGWLTADTSMAGTLGSLRIPMDKAWKEDIFYLLNSEDVFLDEASTEKWDGHDFWDCDTYLSIGNAPKNIREFHKEILKNAKVSKKEIDKALHS